MAKARDQKSDIFTQCVNSVRIDQYFPSEFRSAKYMTLPNSGFTIGYVISAMIMSRVPRKVQFISSGLFLAVANATLGFTLNQEVLYYTYIV